MPSHSPPCDIVVLGSLNMDLVMRLPRLPAAGTTTLGGVFAAHPGGKGANQAIQAARLGAATAIVGCVGDDAYGDELREILLDNGVDVEHLHTVPGSTSGIGLIAIDAATGENMIAVASGANMKVDAALAERQSERLRRAKALLMQSEIPIAANLAAAQIAHESGVLVILNAAPAGDLPDELLRRVDVLVVNEHEARELAQAPVATPVEALASALARRGVDTIVVTLGAGGCLLHDAHSARRVPAFPVQAVDTVGAGDAFAGALAVGLARGESLDHAARRANAAGALATMREGAIPSLARTAEVERMMASGSAA